MPASPGDQGAGSRSSRLQRWVEAISCPRVDEVEDDGPPGPPPPPPIDPVAEPERFEDLLDTTDGTWRVKLTDLRSIRWVDVPERHRESIGARLASHPDPDVRGIGTVALGRWDRHEPLIDLLGDDHASVRKSAMYALGQVGVRPVIADLARAMVESGSGIAATEALRTFSHHARPAERADALFELAATDLRVGIRSSSVRLLADAGDEHHLERLLPYLADAPEVNWAFHDALLDTAVARRADRRRVQALAEVDNIHIAAAAAGVLSLIDG